jgi:hypothetical protein
MEHRLPTVSGTTNLIDILDRILDKGLVVAGDIRISLANVELLTIRIRLLVCSVDKAEQIGMNWWKSDPNLTMPARAPMPAALPGPPPPQTQRISAVRAQAQSMRRRPQGASKRTRKRR